MRRRRTESEGHVVVSEQKDSGDSSLHSSVFPSFSDLAYKRRQQVKDERKALWNSSAFIQALRGINETDV